MIGSDPSGVLYMLDESSIGFHQRDNDMASKTSADPWPGQRLDHEAFGRELFARREALGNPEMPRNSGDRRTDSKRALLAAIEKVGGRW